MLLRHPVLFVVSLLLAGCAPNALQNNQTAPTVFASNLSEQAIPILPVSGELATIPARIGGERSYRFVLDTGATPTALFGNPRLDALGLDLSGDFPVTGVGGGANARASIASAIDIGIGGVEIQGMTPVYLDWTHLPFFHSEATVFWDGVIGYDLYSRVAVDVDPQARMVRFHPAGTDFGWAPEDAIVMPLLVEGTESFVHANVRTAADAPLVPVKLHVDTGKRDGLSLITGRHASFSPPAGALETRSIGISGEAVHRVAPIALLELHGLELTNVATAYVEESSGAFTQNADGRIGAGLLNRFRYIVDYPGAQLILIPNESSLDHGPRLPDTGLALFAIGEQFDELVVVRAHSGAEAAGVKAGDVIVSIDGVAAADLARGRWPELLRGKQVGDRLTVCLKPQIAEDCREIVLTQGV